MQDFQKVLDSRQSSLAIDIMARFGLRIILSTNRTGPPSFDRVQAGSAHNTLSHKQDNLYLDHHNRGDIELFLALQIAEAQALVHVRCWVQSLI